VCCAHVCACAHVQVCMPGCVRAFMGLCAFVCMFMSVRARVCARVHACVHACVCVRAFVCVHVCACVLVLVCVSMLAHVQVCVHARACACTCVCARVRACAYFAMTTGRTGLSLSVSTASIFRTIASPCTAAQSPVLRYSQYVWGTEHSPRRTSMTLPKTTCFPSRCGVALHVMKNCEPLVFGPGSHRLWL
jgi:hypothetical protein